MPTHGGTVRWIIEADDSQFNQTLDNVEKRAETTVKVLNRQDTSFWGSLSKGAKETSFSMGELASSLANVGWTAFNLGATSAVTALTSLVRKGVQATDFLETSRIAMAGLTGSVEAGNEAMSIAADYWSNNPFQRIDVTSATKQLVQFGRNTGQLAGDLKILGDVSLSSGVKIDELARYYARVSASGRAMTMDLEMMSDRGVPIYRELAKQLNTTTQGVRELASQGKIGFEEFRKAMESSVNPEAMEAYENTLARQMDRFKGSLQQLGAALAGYKVVNNEVIISEQGLEKAWMRLVKTLATALRSDKLKEALTTLGETLAKILDKVSAIIPKVVDWLAKVVKFLSENKALLAGVAGVATYFVGGLASKLPIVGGVIEKITGSAKGLVNVFTNLFKKNPLLAVFLGLLTTGLVTAYKNSENFRNSISRLFSALGKLLQKIIPIFQAFVDIIVTIVSSDEFIWIMETLANVLASIAEALASIPTDVLTSLVTAFLMFSLLDSKPILGYAAAIMYIIAVVKKFGPAMIEGIKNTFENVGTAIYNAGKNFIIGFQNGINEGVKAVYNFLKQIAETMVATFQKALGIHSPSTVMAEQGKYVVLGLAEGITNNKSVAQKAMDMLASDILQSIEKIISNKIDFGLLDYPKQYQEWKKVSKMFAVGSQQYQTAIEKMEEARKQANLQILSLQRDYNDTLDSTISKIAKMYGLFDKVDTSGGKSSTDIISDLDQQVAALQNFASTKEALNNIGLETGLVDELQEMGIDAAQELATIAQMSGDEIARLNELWLAKQEQANRAGIEEVKNLKEKTLDQVDEIRKGIDGETIELQDVGGRLVENIAEGIYGAMPTLEDAFAQMGTYMAKAAKELGGSGSGSTGGITPDDIADPLKNTLNEAQNSLNKFAEDFGINMMKSIGIGLVGGIALKWIAPKLISFFKDKVLHKGVQDTIANQLLKSGIGKTGGAGELAKAAQESSKTATSVNQISSSTTSMSPGMSKVSQVEGLIIKGAVAIVAIAVAIAAMAGALWVVNKALENVDLGRLALELVLIVAVTAAMGLIANAIAKVDWKTMAKGLLVIVGIAATVAVLGLALGVVDASIKSDFGALAQKIGAIALAVVAMGVLAGVIGAIMATGVAAIVMGAGLVAMLAMAGAYALIAVELKVLQSIDLDAGKIIEKVNLIKYILEKIGPDGGILENIAEIAKMFLEMIKTIELAVIVAMYAGIAKELELLQKIKINPEKVIAKVNLIKDVINIIGGSGQGSILDQLKSVVSMFMEMAKTIAIGIIVQTYADMADNLDKIQNIEIDKEAIIAKVKLLGEICETVANPTLSNGKDIWEALGDAIKMMLQAGATENAAKILGVYSDMGDSLNKIQNIKADFGAVQNAVNELGKVVQLVIDMKGDGGIFGAINNFFTGNPITVDKVNEVVEILKKLSQIGEAINGMPGVWVDGAKEKIHAVTEVINKIRDIKDIGDIDKKRNTVENATEIAKKLIELEKTLEKSKGEDKTGIISALLNTMSILLDGVEKTLRDRLVDMDTLGRDIVSHFISGMDSQRGLLNEAAARVQGAIWDTIEAKMRDEFYQGEALAKNLKNGFESVSFKTSGENAVQGFIDGSNGKLSAVYKVGRDIADRFLKGLKDRGKEGSPWKTTFESGAWAGLGLAEGIASTEDLVVGEAKSLADQVIDALTMEDVPFSTDLSASVSGSSLPMMDMDGTNYGDKRPVQINQTNNNYTNYSMQKLNTDLAWEISKV